MPGVRKPAGHIRVWRPEGMSRLELRRGLNMSDPVPRHWHDEYQFCLIESGHGEIMHRHRRHETPRNSLFLISPGEVHANNTHEPTGCSYRTIFIGPDALLAAAAEAFQSQVLPSFPSTVVHDRDSIWQFLRLHRSFETSASLLERATLLNTFLIRIIGRYSSTRASIATLSREPQAVSKVRDFIEEHYAESLRLELLADLSKLSPFHLNRAFTAEFGIPPHAFQTQVRVTRAMGLLARGISPAVTALAVGFVDQSHFTRHFKRLCVVTPAQYQKSFELRSVKVH